MTESLLEACLLTDEDMREGPIARQSYDDPLPAIAWGDAASMEERG